MIEDGKIIPDAPRNPSPGMWYFVTKDKQCAGPISTNILIDIYESSQIHSDTLVWSTATNEWLPVQDVLAFVASGSKKISCKDRDSNNTQSNNLTVKTNGNFNTNNVNLKIFIAIIITVALTVVFLIILNKDISNNTAYNITETTGMTTSTVRFDKTFITNHDFKIHFPNDWIEIPKIEIQRHFDNYYEQFPDLPHEEYDYGYQLSSSEYWFQYPYILIQVKNTGKIPEMPKGIDQNEIRRLGSVLKQRHKKSLGELDVNGSKLGSPSLDESQTGWDSEHGVMWLTQESEFPSTGKLTTIMSLRFTQKGVLRIGLVVKKTDESDYIQVFRDIVNAVELGPTMKYQ